MTYGAAMIMFGFCNIVALWCAGYTVYAAAPKTEAQWRQFGHLVLTNPAFRDIVISLSATYGLYFFSSFLHMEPWHMFTSFMCVLSLELSITLLTLSTDVRLDGAQLDFADPFSFLYL